MLEKPNILSNHYIELSQYILSIQKHYKQVNPRFTGHIVISSLEQELLLIIH